MRLLKTSLIVISIIISLWLGLIIGIQITNKAQIVYKEIPVIETVIIEKEIIKEIETPQYDYKPFVITAYSANDDMQGTTNIIYTGFNLDHSRVKNLPIIAVDPDVIPLYSIVEIKDMGYFLALDTGGMIKGNRIDILMDSKDKALEFGKQLADVRVIK